MKKLLRTLRDGPAGREPSFAFIADKYLSHSEASNDPETFEFHALVLLGPVVRYEEDRAVRNGGFVYSRRQGPQGSEGLRGRPGRLARGADDVG